MEIEIVELMNILTPERLKQIGVYIEELRRQDDRSLVIMSSTRIESLLRKAIEQRLIPPRFREDDKRLPLSNRLAPVISLSYRLGLLFQPHADALEALLKLRNKAAHFDETWSLDDPKLQDRITAFAAPWEVEGLKFDDPNSHFQTIYARELQTSPDRPGRAIFSTAAMLFFVFFTPLPHLAVPHRIPLLPHLVNLTPHNDRH